MLTEALKYSADGILVCDQNGSVLFLNTSAQTFTGYSTNEAIGQKIENIFRISNQQKEGLLPTLLNNVSKNSLLPDLRI